MTTTILPTPRTTIRKTGETEVTIAGTDPWTGEPMTRVFWTPMSGGYVREGASHSADDRQVCAGLERLGNTLTADDGDHLLSVIRREWKAYRKAALADTF